MLKQNEDGSHEISLHNVQCFGHSRYPQAQGVLKWSPTAGASYSLIFIDVNRLDGTEFYSRPEIESPGVGRLRAPDTKNPRWIAETDDGTEVRLYVLNEVQTSTQTTGTEGNYTQCEINGTAVYAVVDLPTHRKLAFDNNTSEDFRLFYVGHSGRKFHIREEDVFFRDHDLTEYKNSRCSATLTDEPRVAVVCSNQLVKCKPSAWISFEQAPVDDDLKLFGHNEIQFISFLHGRKIVSHWADRRMSPDLIRRTYYGWVKISNSNYEDCDHQPLPYLSGVVSLQYSGDVLDQLPELYQKFCETSRLIDYEEILHPLWTAFNGVLQDRLALASVSLERLASVWDRARENILEGPPRSNNSVWKQKPFLRRLRKTLIAALNKVWEKQPANERCTSKIVSCLKIKLKEFILGKDCESLSEEERQELKAVISTRLNNITQIPNSANLRRPFEDLALKLATKEQEALMKRNDALHGNQEEGELSILDHDLSTEYFDHLRMLITKFILKVCRYEGPFIDYASRPETGNFSVVALENILPRQKE